MPFVASVLVRVALSLVALTTGVSGASASDDSLLEKVNALRAQYGRRALPQCQAAVAVARTRARDMAAEGYFLHVSPEGISAGTLLRQRGIRADWSEAIAHTEDMHADDGIDLVVPLWRDSPTHLRVLMSRYRCAGTRNASGARGSIFVFVGIKER